MPTTAAPEFQYMTMIEFLNEEMNESPKEIQGNVNKDMEEMNESFKESQGKNS